MIVHTFTDAPAIESAAKRRRVVVVLNDGFVSTHTISDPPEEVEAPLTDAEPDGASPSQIPPPTPSPISSLSSPAASP